MNKSNKIVYFSFLLIFIAYLNISAINQTIVNLDENYNAELHENVESIKNPKISAIYTPNFIHIDGNIVFLSATSEYYSCCFDLHTTG